MHKNHPRDSRRVPGMVVTCSSRCGRSGGARRVSLRFSFMVVLLDDPDVLVETEDGTGQQERLGDVVEQAGGHVVDVDHLIGDERDAARDEQHRAGILGDFEACVFHGVRSFVYTLQSYEK